MKPLEIRTEVKAFTFGSPQESTTRLAGQLQKNRAAELFTLSEALKVSQAENAALREECDRWSATFDALRKRCARLNFFAVVALIVSIAAIILGMEVR